MVDPVQEYCTEEAYYIELNNKLENQIQSLTEKLEEFKLHITPRACTGCCETSDGQSVGDYDFDELLGIEIGSGCDECSNKGYFLDDCRDFPWFIKHQQAKEKLERCKEALEIIRDESEEIWEHQHIFAHNIIKEIWGEGDD